MALDLPETVRAAVRRAQDRLRPTCEGWRWIDAGSIHLTLRFLGEVSPLDLDTQREGWRDAVDGAEAVAFRLGEIGFSPSRSRPRVLWVGVVDLSRDGGLRQLASRIATAARTQGFPSESREFRPHLTLARSRDGSRPTLPVDALAIAGAQAQCTEVILFRSELSPRGARYTRVDAYPLRAASGGDR